MRSPVMGYNHNIRHRGWLFHVQTEDSGVAAPHVITHLFQRGIILATRKLDYAAAAAEEQVRGLMQDQHKAVLRELRAGVHDERIHQFLGEAPAMAREAADSPTPPEVTAPEAALAEPPATDPGGPRWEWSDDLLTDPDQRAPVHEPDAAHPASLARSGTLLSFPAVGPSSSSLPRHSVVFASADEFLGAYYPNARLGGVAMRTPIPVATGDRVLLHLVVQGALPVTLGAEATVEWMRPDGTVGLSFVAAEHTNVRQMVLQARGTRVPRRKAGPRPVSGTGYVAVWLPGGRRAECGADATERGLFIPEDLDVAPGASVPVLLRSQDGAPAVRLQTLAEWNDPTTGGVGLRFIMDDEDRVAVVRWLDTLLVQ